MKVPQICKHLPVLALVVLSNYSFAAKLDVPGIRNFHQVDDHLYRGAQPADESWKHLAKLGIKTIVDLRRPTEHSTEAEEKAVKAAGMRYVNIPMQGVVAPSDESIVRVLALMKSESSGPVFVHCKRGADRTGAVIAVYRMAHDGWANNKAIHEAKSLGMSWMQVGIKHYISTYRAPEVVAEAASEAKPVGVTP
jgi:uncharacterized protein (TIGR01244 family)